MNTITDLDTFYRDVIGPTIAGLYVAFNPLISKIVKAGRQGRISEDGEQIVFGEGGYYQGMSDARLRVGETGRSYDTALTTGLVTPEWQTMRWEVETEMLVSDDAEQGEKYADYLSIMGKRWIDGWKDSHSIDIYGAGDSSLASISSISGTTITIDENQVIRKLPEGMYVDIGDTADFIAGNNASIYRRRIVEQLDVNQFTIDDATNLTTGMEIRRELRRSGMTYDANTNIRTFEGLRSNLSSAAELTTQRGSSSLFGIDRSKLKYKPQFFTATAATGLTYDDVVGYINDVEDIGVDMQDLYLPKVQFTKLTKRLVSDIITNTKNEAFLTNNKNIRQGIRMIEFLFDGKLIEMYTDTLLKSDKGYGLDPNSWRSYVGANGIMVYGDGKPKIVPFGEDIAGKGMIYNTSDPHSHAIEAVFYGQYACVDPKKNLVIDFS